MALGLSPRIEEGTHRAWRLAHPNPVRRSRRQIAARLPSAVVSGRDRRGHRARLGTGVPEARSATLGAERQRRRDDGGRDHSGPHPARYPAPDHVALQPVSERKARSILGARRGPADRHAGGRARSDIAHSQRSDASLGRARLQPQAPLRDRRSPYHALPCRSRGDAAVPRQRYSAPRLHALRPPHAEEERRHRRHRGPPL